MLRALVLPTPPLEVRRGLMGVAGGAAGESGVAAAAGVCSSAPGNGTRATQGRGVGRRALLMQGREHCRWSLVHRHMEGGARGWGGEHAFTYGIMADPHGLNLREGLELRGGCRERMRGSKTQARA